MEAISNFCRACLSADETKSVSETRHENLLRLITADRISIEPPNDRLCTICEWKLSKIESFIVQCQRADRIIKKVTRFNRTSEFANFARSRKMSMADIVLLNLPTDRDARAPSLKRKRRIGVESGLLYYPAPTFADENEMIFTGDSCRSLDAQDIVKTCDQEAEEGTPPLNSTSCSMTLEPEQPPAENANENGVNKLTKLTLPEQIMQHDKLRENPVYVNAEYKCEMCIVAFKNELTLKKHLSVKHSEAGGPFVCPICLTHFTTQERKDVHLKERHVYKLACEDCNGLLFRHRKTFREHQSWHEGKTWKCDVCSIEMTTQKRLSKHIKIFHTKRRFRCRQCKKTFIDRCTLKQHKIKHLEPTNVCEVCDKKFSNLNQLNNHVNMHVDSRRYYCVECNVYFKYEKGLSRHLKKASAHVDPNTLKFSCEQCPKKFTTAELLNKHVDVRHLNKKRYSCKICSTSYASSRKAELHRKTVHEGIQLIRNYKCDVCDKAFLTPGTLERHFRVHTGDKPYECSECPDKFNQKSTLKTHIQLVHLKMKRAATKKN